MKLGIDIDGTIKHTHQAAIKVYNEELNMNVKEEEVTTFYLDEPFGLTDEEGKKMWRKLEGKIYTIGIPLEHASESLQQLSKEGHEIYFITARPGYNHIKDITIDWLKKHRFPYQDSHLFMNAHKKGEVAKKLGIDLFFEDDPEHIRNLLSSGIHTVVMDMFYNKNCPESIPRISDWYQGINYIRQFKKIYAK